MTGKWEDFKAGGGFIKFMEPPQTSQNPTNRERNSPLFDQKRCRTTRLDPLKAQRRFPESGRSGVQTVPERRNPLLLFLLSGLLLLRLDTRQLLALLFQLPPRMTRLLPLWPEALFSKPFRHDLPSQGEGVVNRQIGPMTVLTVLFERRLPSGDAAIVPRPNARHLKTAKYSKRTV